MRRRFDSAAVLRVLWIFAFILAFGFIAPLVAQRLFGTAEFIAAFWPNYISTALGVGLGVPIALWINQQALSQSESVRRQQERQRLIAALKTLERALNSNLERIVNINRMMNSEDMVISTQLDVSAWDAVKLEVIQHLRDPSLQSQLAYHFSQITEVDRLVTMYVNYSTGQESGYPLTQDILYDIKSYLQRSLPDIISEAKVLSDHITKMLSPQSMGGQPT